MSFVNNKLHNFSYALARQMSIIFHQFSSVITFISALLCSIAVFIRDQKSTESNLPITQQMDEKSNCSTATITTTNGENFLRHFADCFSPFKNYRFIMSTRLSEKSIEVIHGLRAVVAFWIISGHLYYYAYGAWDNLQLIFVHLSVFIQPFFAAALGTDSFFTIR